MDSKASAATTAHTRREIAELDDSVFEEGVFAIRFEYTTNRRSDLSLPSSSRTGDNLPQRIQRRVRRDAEDRGGRCG